MTIYNFNPFPVTIEELEGVHLSLLTEVSEDWYLDYKEQMIDKNKLSKHISAFANQYGGWLFFGIKESRQRSAGDFIGIPEQLIEKHLLKIKNAAMAINPTVYYEVKVIYGPVSEITLPDKRAIIVVFIPEGVSSPYIHSTGKIYMRESDQSESKAVTDIYTLNRLYEKGYKRKQRTLEFLSKKSNFDKQTYPIVYVHLLTNPLFEKKFDIIEYKDFRKIFLDQEDWNGPHCPMNSIHSTLGGYIARQTKNNDPMTPVLSLRWWHEGNALLTIPLNTINSDSSYGYEHQYSFLNELSTQNLQSASVCDFNPFFIAVTALYSEIKEVYKKNE